MFNSRNKILSYDLQTYLLLTMKWNVGIKITKHVYAGSGTAIIYMNMSINSEDDISSNRIFIVISIVWEFEEFAGRVWTVCLAGCVGE